MKGERYMDLQSIVRDALLAIQAVVPETKVDLTYKGEIAVGTRCNREQERINDMYGNAQGYIYSVWINNKAFTAPIEAGQRIFIGEDEQSILTVAPDPVSGLTRLDIGDKYA